MHAWLLLPAEALEDRMSSSSSGQPLPWTLAYEDVICFLAEHWVCQVSGSEQASEQVWHDKNLKVSDLVSYVHCRLSNEC
jgi:hypothetical protein